MNDKLSLIKPEVDSETIALRQVVQALIEVTSVFSETTLENEKNEDDFDNVMAKYQSILNSKEIAIENIEVLEAIFNFINNEHEKLFIINKIKKELKSEEKNWGLTLTLMERVNDIDEKRGKPVTYSDESLKKVSKKSEEENILKLKILLVELEDIVGNECYNSNIQNYSSGGILESEGRKYRYPVTLGENSQAKKRLMPTDDFGTLMTGHYKFGANNLNIFTALSKIVKHLELNYDFKIPIKE